MSGKRLAAAAVLLLPLAAAEVRANDSTAVLGAGGLVLARSPDIEMKAEDLFVSRKEIRVSYRFAVTGAKEVDTLVAFPLPDLTGSGPAGTQVTLPKPDQDNFVGFQTLVDGRPVATEIEQRVVAVGIDRTDLLKSLKIPLNPLGPKTMEALDKLPKERWDEFVRLGLAVVDVFDAGKGEERHLAPTWTLRTTFYWRQVFPAGRELRVEHRYQPVAGYSVGTMLGRPDAAKDASFKADQAKYCIDRSFLDGARKLKEPREARLDYVLTTGANWAAPIGDFRLVVDKGAASSLVSFCAEGVKKIGPTQFEVRKKDFRPERDLAVVIVGPDIEP